MNDDLLDRVIRNLQAGIDEEKNFKRLFDRYQRGVLQFFRNRGIPEEDCHELNQEVWIGVYKGIGGFAGESKFATWLFRIAHHKWANHLRSNQAQRRGDRGQEDSLESMEEKGKEITEDQLPESPSATGSPEDHALEKERARRLRAAIQKLPRQMGRCADLQRQGLSGPEIAALLKLSPGAVKAHLHHAKKKLRVLLDSEDDKESKS